MVTEYGMSANVGAVKLGQSQGEVFLGRDMGHQRDYSEEIAEKVDAEVRTLIEQAHDEAWQVLNDNRDILDKLAAELLEHETLDHNQIAEIFKDVSKLPERPLWLRATVDPSRIGRRSPSPTDKMPIDQGAVDGGADPTTRSRSRPRRVRAHELAARDGLVVRRPEEGVPRPVWTPGASSAPCTRSCSRSARTRPVRARAHAAAGRRGLRRVLRRPRVDLLSHLADTVPLGATEAGVPATFRRGGAARHRVPPGLRAPPAAVRRHRPRGLPAGRAGRGPRPHPGGHRDARRAPQLQERLTEEIADASEADSSRRACCRARRAAPLRHHARITAGARRPTITIASRGALAEPAARAEIIALIGAAERG